MELIYALDRRRLQRELRRREKALREAARAPKTGEAEPKAVVPKAYAAVPKSETAAKSEAPMAQYLSNTLGGCECDFCGRGFHGYGQFLNHKCDEDH